MAKWDEAVTRVLDDDAPAEDLATAVRAELVALWSDLENAERDALNGIWSMQCDWITERIVTLSRLVGATPWDEIQIPLLQSGLYEGILRSAGIAFTPPDMAEVNRIAAEQVA